MKPEQKAEELYNKFLPHAYIWDCYNDAPIEDTNHAREAALLCVKECEKVNRDIWEAVSDKPFKKTEGYKYWKDVKSALKKIR